MFKNGRTSLISSVILLYRSYEKNNMTNKDLTNKLNLWKDVAPSIWMRSSFLRICLESLTFGLSLVSWNCKCITLWWPSAPSSRVYLSSASIALISLCFKFSLALISRSRTSSGVVGGGFAAISVSKSCIGKQSRLHTEGKHCCWFADAKYEEIFLIEYKGLFKGQMMQRETDHGRPECIKFCCSSAAHTL